MTAILDLPLEVLTLILGHLEAFDLLSFCATCRSVRQIYRPDKLHLLLESHEEPSTRNQLAAELSQLMRHHALAELFHRFGRRCKPYNFDWLFQLGASFAPIPHGKLLETVFLEDGPGKTIDFMEAHGATFDAIPGGLNALLEATIRAERIGEPTEYLLNRGAKVQDVPAGVDSLVEYLFTEVGDFWTIAFVLQNSEPLQCVSDKVKSILCENFSMEGNTEDFAAVIKYIPNATQMLLEELVRQGGIFDDVDELLNDGASLRQIQINGSTLESLIEEGADLKDIGDMVLYGAACLGDLELIKVLLERGVLVNTVGPDRGCTALHGSCRERRCDVADYLLMKGADPSVINDDGFTPLHEAVNNGDVKIVKTLISHGADLNSTEINKGWTPLHSAIRGIKPDIAIALLEVGADPLVRDVHGWMAIHHAAYCGQDDVLKLLISDRQSADVATVHETDGGWTPILVAASGGWLSTMKMLQSYGADLHRGNDKGITPLLVAAEDGQMEMCEYLIAQGASVNVEALDLATPLHAAAEHNHPEVVRRLIDAGANVEAIMDGDEGCCNLTPLYLAAARNSIDAARCLLNAKAKVNYEEGDALDPIFAAASHGRLEMLNFLFDNGASVHATQDVGFLPLHAAAVRGHTRVVKNLLERGSEVNAVDEDGTTPLILAVAENQLRCVELLLEHGADPNSTSKDGTLIPVQCAVMQGRLSIVKALVGKHADLEQRGLKGITCMHLAANGGSLAAIRYLVRQRVELNPLEYYGRTPVQLAAGAGHLEAVKYLIRRGATYASRDLGGLTALTDACSGGHSDVVEYLLDFDPAAFRDTADSFNRTALHWAVANGHYKVAQLLIDRDINLTDVDGYALTAFDWAMVSTKCGELATPDRKYTSKAERQPMLRRSVRQLSHRLLQSNRRQDELGFHELGHCLMFLGDIAAAKLCYQQEIIVHPESGIVFHNVSCECCDRACFDFSGSRFVCTECPDVDVCESCRNNAMDKIPMCQSHEFMEVAGVAPDQGEDVGEEIPTALRESLKRFAASYAD